MRAEPSGVTIRGDHRRSSRRRGVGVAAAALALIAGLAPSVQADGGNTAQGHRWADVADAEIRPGVQVRSDSGQCTSNFVFTKGDRVFLGTAAHCASLGGQSDTDGCTTPTRPLGTKFTVEGTGKSATMVYSSWVTMQERKEKDTFTCLRNDFALLELDRRDHRKVNPTVPHFGGPTGIGPATSPGSPVASYQNSGLRFGLEPLKPKAGASLGMSGSGWSHVIYSASPGVPGDSGSGYLDSRGRAIGVLSTLAIAPAPASNNATSLAKALAYLDANDSGLRGVSLATGTLPFVLD